MKRVITLLLAAGLVLGTAAASQAADIKAKGFFQFQGSVGDRSIKDHDGVDKFQVGQRLRAQIDVIASENLKGVYFLEVGHITWGKGGDSSGTSAYTGNPAGGALGADGTNLHTRYMYLDWLIPNTDIQVRMGIQNYTLPTAVIANTILGGGAADGAGITLSTQFTENVGATLFWLRAYDGDRAYVSEDMDFIGLTIPLSFDGLKVTPWGMYGIIGNDAFVQSDGSAITTRETGQAGALANMLPVGQAAGTMMEATPYTDKDHGSAWWAGFSADLKIFDPFRVAVDAVYGSVDLGTVPASVSGWDHSYDMKRAGWYAAILAEFKLDFMTPGVQFWYSSGDDDNPFNGSEMLPTVRADITISDYAHDGQLYNSYNSLLGTTIAGTWGVYAYLKDISFIEDLSHVLRVGYIQGTNNTAMVGDEAWLVGTPGVNNNQIYLTTSDRAVEVNFDTSYNIYKNFVVILELGYIYLDLDEDVWGRSVVDSYRKNNFRGALEMQYTF